MKQEVSYDHPRAARIPIAVDANNLRNVPEIME